MMDDSSTLPAPIDAGARRVSTLDQLADIPEEEIWSAKAEERADPAGLPARRSALHAHAGDHDAGRAAPSRPQGRDRLGAVYARFEHAAASTLRCASLRAAGAETVFREVASGAKTDGAQLRRALAQLAAGGPGNFVSSRRAG